MNERNVTSAWLAEQVGISKVAISNIVTGKSSPSLDNLLKIAGVLNVSITKLIGEEKEETPLPAPTVEVKFILTENHVCRNIRIYEGKNTINKNSRSIKLRLSIN